MKIHFLFLSHLKQSKILYIAKFNLKSKISVEGPMSHDQPAYASVPGIRVYGMMCVRDSLRINRSFRYRRSLEGKCYGKAFIENL